MNAMPTPPLLALPAELCIHGAAALHGQMRAALGAACAAQSPDALHLSGADVEEVDTAGLQLLVALAHAARERAVALRLHDASEPLKRAIAAFGLEAFLTPSEGASA
jgi:anti-anti-sigma regulatory factor